MKTAILTGLLMINLTQVAVAKNLSESEYAKIYQSEYNKIKNDLGPQCAFNTLKEVLAAEAEVKTTEPDYSLSYNDFMNKVKALGLLDPVLFKNPQNTDPNAPFSAINAILSWTEYYKKNDFIYKPEKCFLSDKELFSIFYYTGEGFRILNNAIRSNNQELMNKLRTIGLHLGLGVQKLKPYKGFVKRVRQLNSQNPNALRDFRNEHQVGKIVTQAAYTSTTVGATTFTGNVKYLLQTKKNCFYIADFSLVEQKINGYSQMEEEEVLCLPMTKFKVNYYKEVGSEVQVYLEEVTE